MSAPEGCGAALVQEDVQEFHPYVFQIFAQLIETRPAPLPASYMAIFPPLLSPLFWERPGNVPALVRLLQVRRLSAPAVGIKVVRILSWSSKCCKTLDLIYIYIYISYACH